jgi:hypothetical protein
MRDRYYCVGVGLRGRVGGKGGERDTYGRNKDKQRFKNLNILSKQIQSKVDEDEILRQLG